MASKQLKTTIALYGKLDASVQKAMEQGQKLAKDTGKAMAAALAAGSAAAVASAGAAALAAVNIGGEWASAYHQVEAATGAAGAELAEIQGAMQDLYAVNYGQTIADVGTAVGTVQKQLDGLNQTQLTQATKGAMLLEEVFAYDLDSSVRSAKALVDNFGLGAEEAFSYIATGAQNGLDFSGELLDSIQEYSTQFAKMGLSADDMFQIMEVGAESGAWNLDKVGDAIKELGIRAVDGSDTTEAGFLLAGLSATKMAAAFAQGGESARDAFFTTVEAISSMEDPLKQNQAGAALFGTLWEELGPDVVGQLANITDESYAAGDAIADLEKTNFDSLDEVLDGLWRQMEVQLLPAATDLYELFMDYVPQIQQAIGGVDIAGGLETGMEFLSFLMDNGDLIAATAVGIGTGVATWNAVTMVMGMVGAVKAWKLATDGMTISQKLLNLAMSANPIGIAITAVAALAAGFIYLWNTSEEFRGFFIGLGEDVVGIASTVGSAVGNLLIAPVNWAISGINGMINAVNSISFEVPDWVPIPGLQGKTIGFQLPNIPEIPAFAKGGTVEEPQLAIVGDAPETIVPHGDTPHNLALLQQAAEGVGVPLLHIPTPVQQAPILTPDPAQTIPVMGGREGNIIYITFQAHIQAQNREEARQGALDAEAEFERRMDDYFDRKRRVAF